MKILLVSDFIYPQMHGISVRCQEWINEIRSMGHEVRVLSSPKNHESDFCCKSSPLPFNPDVNVVIPKLKTFFQVLKYAPDVIHAVSPSWPEVYQWVNLYACMTRTPLVTSHHVNLVEYAKKYWGDGTFIYKIFNFFGVSAFLDDPLRYSELICGPTFSSMDSFKLSRLYDEKKIKVFSTGINRDVFSAGEVDYRDIVRVREEISEYIGFEINNIVLYAGRIAREKGLDIFLELARRNPSVAFVICGKGPEESMCRSFCDKHKLNNVYFAGKKSQRELAIFYSASDLMLFPSSTETFGFAVIECMSMGTPVLMPKVPVFEELHGDFYEYMVDHSGNYMDTIISYEIIISQLFNYDESAKKDLAFRLKNHCKNYTWKKSANDITTIYDMAIKNYQYRLLKNLNSFVGFVFKVPISKTLMVVSKVFFNMYLRDEKKRW